MVLLKDFIKEHNEKFAQENPPDFTTHLNYVGFLNEISKDLTISCKRTIEKQIPDNPILGKKINLIKLTLKGIEAEYKIILKNPEYAIVCVSWISVKSYYLLYNLCLILKYLMTGMKSSFNSSHISALEDFKGYIVRGELEFNKAEFNKRYSCREILNWKSKSGSNIKFVNVDKEERFLQIIKKLANYSLEEFKRSKNIKSFRSKQNKEILNGFLNNKQISICEFFYWYRIKA
ncbi:MAG: hypothetical protein Q8R31_04915, partial [Candidatus Omnitrophota bacterium]|nr:hypothetical protein [Candidatus Omnitrophota bacterium]